LVRTQQLRYSTIRFEEAATNGREGYESARYLLDRASTPRPKLAPIARRGDEDRQAGNFAGAIADCSQAIRLYVTANPSEPELVAIYCSRGDVFMSSSEYGRAIADYTDALGLDAGNARALSDRANAYRAEGDRAPVIADYVGAIQRDSDSDLIWVDRGDELQRAGDATEASQLFRDSVEVFQRLTKAEPTIARWRRDLALSYFKLGSAVDRQERFADALEAHRNGLAHGANPLGKRTRQQRIAKCPGRSH
jgi:tetratricopeptide (TPR) repeat protein